jgi:hypothetical protein
MDDPLTSRMPSSSSLMLLALRSVMVTREDEVMKMKGFWAVFSISSPEL